MKVEGILPNSYDYYAVLVKGTLMTCNSSSGKIKALSFCTIESKQNVLTVFNIIFLRGKIIRGKMIGINRAI